MRRDKQGLGGVVVEVRTVVCGCSLGFRARSYVNAYVNVVREGNVILPDSAKTHRAAAIHHGTGLSPSPIPCSKGF